MERIDPKKPKKHPAWMTKAKNLFRDTGRALYYWWNRKQFFVDERDYQKRIAECRSCLQWYDKEKDTCTHRSCGCVMSRGKSKLRSAARWKSKRCPINKWPESRIPLPVVNAKPRESRFGVVIGSFGIPGCVELNIKAIRKTCGDVPILIYDDQTPHEKGQARLKKIATDNKCSLLFSESKLGHTSGDMATMTYGLKWAKENGIDCFAKLSQRFIPLREKWLQKYGEELLQSGNTIASQPCLELIGMRTECVLFNVSESYKRRLDRLLMENIGRQNPETMLQSLADSGQIRMMILRLVNKSRFNKIHDVFWHNTHTTGEYQGLANSFGIELDPWFHVDDWQNVDQNYRM